MYRAGIVQVDGDISIRVFDGTITMRDLRLERPLSLVPLLYANIEVSELDLEKLTETFAFGRVQGRLSGQVRQLSLQDWQPVSFEAVSATPKEDDTSDWIVLARLQFAVISGTQATEQDEAQRAAFQAQMAALPSERVVVIDETSINLAMTRRYARAPRGQRSAGRVPRNNGKNVPVISTLGLQGMVTRMSREGAVDTAVFNIFVDSLLVPTLHPGAIVVLDNLRVHHSSRIEHAVQKVGGHGVFLPPYSPDLSPIEPCWATVKTALRLALRTLTTEDIRGWFRHCGYPVIAN